jgi:hypothetical protein
MPSVRDLSTAMERLFNGFVREYVLNYTGDAGDKGRQLTADLFQKWQIFLYFVLHQYHYYCIYLVYYFFPC